MKGENPAALYAEWDGVFEGDTAQGGKREALYHFSGRIPGREGGGSRFDSKRVRGYL
jgi:hypothetical protein